MDHAGSMRRAYDLINARDIDGFGALLRDDFVEHEDLMGLPQTKEGVKEFFRANFAAFSDFRLDPEDIIASGDKVVARFRMTGTNDGEFMGMPATGKAVDVQGVDIIRFDEDGLGAEHWGVYDSITMLQQLGAIPEM